MSPDPPPAEELGDEPANKRFVSSMIRLAEMRLREELKKEWVNTGREAMREIAKIELERVNQTRDRAEQEVKLKRSEEWLNRLQSAFVGVVITILFTILFAVCASQCSDLNHRLSTLENKQSK